MKNIFYIGIFATLFITISNVGNNPPENVKTSVVQNMPIEVVESIDTSPTQKEIKPVMQKPNDVTDGVWEWKSLVEQYFPQSEVINALRIMSAENGSGDPNRISKPNHDKYKSRDIGLFQINSYWHKGRVNGDLSKLQDAETNVRIASEIFKEQGWRPWVTAKKLGL